MTKAMTKTKTQINSTIGQISNMIRTTSSMIKATIKTMTKVMTTTSRTITTKSLKPKKYSRELMKMRIGVTLTSCLAKAPRKQCLKLRRHRRKELTKLTSNLCATGIHNNQHPNNKSHTSLHTTSPRPTTITSRRRITITATHRPRTTLISKSHNHLTSNHPSSRNQRPMTS